MRLRRATVATAVALAASTCAVAALAAPPFRGPVLTHAAVPPDLSLRDQHGKRITLSGLRGRVVLLTFLYTRCPDLCPLTATNINVALERLGAARRRVAVVAISVDPVGDTPRSVRAFIRTHGLLPQFHYLTGSRAALTPIWRAYHVQPLQANAADPDHSLYTLLVDRTGKARVLFDALASPRDIAHDARLLIA